MSAAARPASLSEFDWAYNGLVEEPWRERCARAQSPWVAPRDLRDRWLSAMRGGGRAEALAGAVGLCRSAMIDNEERAALDAFFRDAAALRPANAEVLVIMLVTGATPPPNLWAMYFGPMLERDPAGTPVLWLTLGWWLRHPSNADTARHVLRSGPALAARPLGRFMVAEAMLNPLVRPAEELFDAWLQALACFHPQTTRPPASLLEALPLAGWLCRWDRRGFSPEPGGAAARPLEWLVDQRRRVGDVMAEASDIHRPTREVIESFAGPDPMRRTWRYYLPLLAYPWDSPPEPVADCDSHALALLVAGHPPIAGWVAAMVKDPAVRGLLGHHPGSGVVF